MKNDEELQRLIESDLPVNLEDLDVRAYKQVFAALKQLPEGQLSKSLADNIVAMVVARQKRESSRDFWWFGIGMLCLIVACVVAVAYTGFTFSLGFLRNISAYAGVFLFGAAFIIALNFLERKVIHKRPEM